MAYVETVPKEAIEHDLDDPGLPARGWGRQRYDPSNLAAGGNDRELVDANALSTLVSTVWPCFTDAGQKVVPSCER